MPDESPDGLNDALKNAHDHLLGLRGAHGYWEGKLSASALSTATAVTALHLVDPDKHRDLVDGGLRWLAENQNDDGGWGDTTISHSNISTTLLVWAAFGATEDDGNPRQAGPATIKKAETWIRNYVGSLEPGEIAVKVRERYGRDKTFSVPILMMCAIGGRLGDDPEKAWKRVMALPFELAVFPRTWFAALRLPVVSYALPALIAIGYARFEHAPPIPPVRWWRAAAWKRASRLLCEIQPPNGGFLEATPLTSFVSMALASSGEVDHLVVRRGVRFLADSVEQDGSWPIDTNLATWVTTLSVKALHASEAVGERGLANQDKATIRDWLLGQHYTEVHPFTNAPPGGWAWTDLPGGVPDADDTPGAMLALDHLQDDDSRSACRDAAEKAATWLADVQNRDGGIPTFCRGWGKLPFDRSSPDLTAHTLRAWAAWRDDFSPTMQNRVDIASEDALTFLQKQQDEDGAWTPLWFGNQHVDDETNRTYGTAHILFALAEREGKSAREMADKGARWLIQAQNRSGGWGGDTQSPEPSIEETALAVDALALAIINGDPNQGDRKGMVAAIKRGVKYLINRTSGGTEFPVAPIGFYFAKLWYHEELYPVVWTVSALANAKSVLEKSHPS